MYYEITQDGAGFLPSESARMDVDGLYIRTLSIAYCLAGASGILLINGSAALSPFSIIKQVPLVGTPHMFKILQRHEEETAAAAAVKKLFTREFPTLKITHESTAADTLLLYTDGDFCTDPAQIAQAEFSIITPPEREKRLAINTLNNLFPPLKFLDVHVDMQFNGEAYLQMPTLQLSQREMKTLANSQSHPSPYKTALKQGLCMGLFNITPRFTNLTKKPGTTSLQLEGASDTK